MPHTTLRRHLLGYNLFGLLLLLVVGASGQGTLYWMQSLDADEQLQAKALPQQQLARQALDGLRTGIEQALQQQAVAEQEALTLDEASLFLDAHATALGAALGELEALPLSEPSRNALQALTPKLKSRLVDIQNAVLVSLKNGNTSYLPAIRQALDALGHELDQLQALLLGELQTRQQESATSRQQAQIAQAALLALCALALLAMGAWQRRQVLRANQDSAVLPSQQQEPALASSASSLRTSARERVEDLQQRETLAMLRNLSQSTDQLTRLVSQIQAPGPTAAAANPRPAAAQSVRPQGTETPARPTPTSHPMADLAGAIDDIAFQSSMLAMNAEAARSGEPGQGYAQLVEEVRLLASRSAQTAKAFKSRIQPQAVTEPAAEPVIEAAVEAVPQPATKLDLKQYDDDDSGVVVQLRQVVEAPAAAPRRPVTAAAQKKSKASYQAKPEAEAQPQLERAQPSAVILKTGRLLRTRG